VESGGHGGGRDKAAQGLFDLDLLLEIGVLFRDSEVPVIFTEQPLTLTTARLRPGDAVEAVKGFHLQIGATVCPHPGHDGIAEALVVRVRFADVHPVAEALVAGAAIIGACRVSPSGSEFCLFPPFWASSCSHSRSW